MKATDLLREEHKGAMAILNGMVEAQSIEKKSELFSQLKVGLPAHAGIEEEIFYPGLVSALGEAGSKLLKQDSARHDNVKRLFGELLGMKVGEGKFDDVVRELRDAVDVHAQEEDSDWFSTADQLLSSEENEALGGKLLSRREELFRQLSQA